MGVHLVLPSRLNAGLLNAEKLEALIYEPMANGAMRLVGVAIHPYSPAFGRGATIQGGGVPAPDGNLLNYIAAPNRYGLPAFYEMHVWAWEHNPKGSYADWNTARHMRPSAGSYEVFFAGS